MKRVGEFRKVSKEQFIKDFIDVFGDNYSDEGITKMYENIKIPTRATKYSAGYDFDTPIDIELKPGETIKIPTGIRCKIDEDWFLAIAPRSGLGFKFRVQLDNTLGIIDSDYYNSSNEGHIMIKLTNDSKTNKKLVLEPFSKVVQGIFVPYGITVDDDADGIRDGGFGSTDKE